MRRGSCGPRRRPDPSCSRSRAGRGRGGRLAPAPPPRRALQDENEERGQPALMERIPQQAAKRPSRELPMAPCDPALPGYGHAEKLISLGILARPSFEEARIECRLFGVGQRAQLGPDFVCRHRHRSELSHLRACHGPLVREGSRMAYRWRRVRRLRVLRTTARFRHQPLGFYTVMSQR
jgi:hypothetical protein